MGEKVLNDLKLNFSDVMIKPKFAYGSDITRKNVNPHVNYDYFIGTPVIASNIVSIGTFEVARELASMGLMAFLHKEYTAEQYKNFFWENELWQGFVGITTGVAKHDKKKLDNVLSDNCPVRFISVDIANVYGMNMAMASRIQYLKEKYPNKIIVAGNVCDSEGVHFLANAGADIVKIGVGVGALCLTTKQVGVGYPQLSAILECAEAADSSGVRTIADGGIVNFGDIMKAFGAGTDFVMVGSLLAQYTEQRNHFGLGSETMYSKFKPLDYEYRPNEGREVEIPRVGFLGDFVTELHGVIRSACAYTGARYLGEFSEKVQFVRSTIEYNKSLEK